MKKHLQTIMNHPKLEAMEKAAAVALLISEPPVNRDDLARLAGQGVTTLRNSLRLIDATGLVTMENRGHLGVGWTWAWSAPGDFQQAPSKSPRDFQGDPSKSPGDFQEHSPKSPNDFQEHAPKSPRDFQGPFGGEGGALPSEASPLPKPLNKKDKALGKEKGEGAGGGKDHRAPAIIVAWQREFQMHFELPYTLDRKKDAGQLARFLRERKDLTTDTFMAAAHDAWEHLEGRAPYLFQKAQTLADFCLNFTPIQVEAMRAKRGEPVRKAAPWQDRNRNVPTHRERGLSDEQQQKVVDKAAIRSAQATVPSLRSDADWAIVDEHGENTNPDRKPWPDRELAVIQERKRKKALDLKAQLGMKSGADLNEKGQA